MDDDDDDDDEVVSCMATSKTKCVHTVLCVMRVFVIIHNTCTMQQIVIVKRLDILVFCD